MLDFIGDRAYISQLQSTHNWFLNLAINSSTARRIAAICIAESNGCPKVEKHLCARISRICSSQIYRFPRNPILRDEAQTRNIRCHPR